jgi:hypothetical protein
MHLPFLLDPFPIPFDHDRRRVGDQRESVCEIIDKRTSMWFSSPAFHRRHRVVKGSQVPSVTLHHEPGAEE